MRGFRVFVGAAGMAALLLGTSGAQAGPFFATSDTFSYTGTVAAYGTLAEAQAGGGTAHAIPTATAGSESTLPGARDASLFIGSSGPGQPSNANIFSTAWYYSTTPQLGLGAGNPNNTNVGFVQLFDDDGSTDTASTGGWTDESYTTFSLFVEGGAASSVADGAQLWPAPGTDEDPSLTDGSFVEYELSLTATFASAATLSMGWRQTSETPIDVDGYFRGIFQNNSGLFYVFDFVLQNGSWAASNGASFIDGGDTFFTSNFFTAPEVPEPAAMAFFVVALAGLFVMRRAAAAPVRRATRG